MISIDTSALSVAMRKLEKRIGSDLAREIVREEAAQFIKTTIKLDNKLAMLNSNGAPNSQAIRRLAVERSVLRTMRPLSVMQFETPRMRKFIAMLTAIGDNGLTTEKLRKFKGPLSRVTAVDFSERIHRANINPRYGITNNTGFVLLGAKNQNALAQYIKQEQDMVGFKFSGFLSAARYLSMRMPRWIARHSASAGGVMVDMGSGGNSSITIFSSSSKDVKLVQRARDAIRTRTGAIETKVRRILAGQATNLGFMKIGARSTMTYEEYVVSRERMEAFDASI